MRVMLVTDNPDCLAAMQAEIRASGATVDIAEVAAPVAGLGEKLKAAPPEMMVIRVADAAGFPYSELTALPDTAPVLMLADMATPEAMAEAAQAGVNALLPAAVAIAAFPQVAAWARAQHRATRELRARLKEKEAKLADRIAIERAKGIVMKLKGLEEDSAYHEIRKLAMKRSLPMRVVADQIIDTATMVG